MILLKEKVGENHRGDYFNLMRAKPKHFQDSNIIVLFMCKKLHCWADSWSNAPFWGCGSCGKAGGCCPCPRFHFWKSCCSDATVPTDGTGWYGGGPTSHSPENNEGLQATIRGRESMIMVPAYVPNTMHRGAWNWCNKAILSLSAIYTHTHRLPVIPRNREQQWNHLVQNTVRFFSSSIICAERAGMS